ncbi:MAG: hypothetical protein ACLGI6_11650 [Gammaproteobacteria bacterium]
MNSPSPPPDANAVPVIDTSHAGFITRGVSISISSCGAERVPSIARGLGCRVSPDRHTVTVLVSKKQADEVLRHVRERAVIAVSFSEPVQQRALQLKGQDASTANATPADLQLALRYRDSYAQQLRLLGMEARLIETLLACAAPDLASITFSPTQAFAQTPGPNAGQALLVHA